MGFAGGGPYWWGNRNGGVTVMMVFSVGWGVDR